MIVYMMRMRGSEQLSAKSLEVSTLRLLYIISAKRLSKLLEAG